MTKILGKSKITGSTSVKKNAKLSGVITPKVAKQIASGVKKTSSVLKKNSAAAPSIVGGNVANYFVRDNENSFVEAVNKASQKVNMPTSSSSSTSSSTTTKKNRKVSFKNPPLSTSPPPAVACSRLISTCSARKASNIKQLSEANKKSSESCGIKAQESPSTFYWIDSVDNKPNDLLYKLAEVIEAAFVNLDGDRLLLEITRNRKYYHQANLSTANKFDYDQCRINLTLANKRKGGVEENTYAVRDVILVHPVKVDVEMFRADNLKKKEENTDLKKKKKKSIKESSRKRKAVDEIEEVEQCEAVETSAETYCDETGESLIEEEKPSESVVVHEEEVEGEPTDWYYTASGEPSVDFQQIVLEQEAALASISQ